MRTVSASLRVLTIGVVLVAVAIACVVFLVAAGVLHLTGGHVVGASAALLLLAMLAASVSALGPKYRPTPLLTPLAAGVFAMLFATTMGLAAYTHAGPKSRASAATMVKPAPMMRPVKTAPVIEKVAVEPEPAPVIQTKAVRQLDESFDTNKQADRAPVAAPSRLPSFENAIVTPAAAAPAEMEPPKVREPAPAPRTQLASRSEPSAPAKPSSAKTVPMPMIAPGDIDSPLNLQATFDPTGPALPKAGTPLALEDSVKSGSGSAIPPRPRIRPCGAGGPACP